MTTPKSNDVGGDIRPLAVLDRGQSIHRKGRHQVTGGGGRIKQNDHPNEEANFVEIGNEGGGRNAALSDIIQARLRERRSVYVGSMIRALQYRRSVKVPDRGEADRQAGH